MQTVRLQNPATSETHRAQLHAIEGGATVVELRPRAPSAPASLGGLLAFSAEMKKVLERTRRVAATELPVLVLGPSGSGKELLARAIHDESSRAHGPFLALNCGALAPSLIESELFGHVKGAFTGATETKQGAFEACEGGTLFLDEIGELPLELQPRLLRVLEAQAVRKVGGSKEQKVNVRIVAATHRDLPALVAQGLFREDLYHRLMVLDLTVPSLAERPEDVLPLAQHFLASACPNRNRRFSVEAEHAMLRHPWGGNVRELRNAVLRATVMSDEDVLSAEDLGLKHAGRAATPVAPVRPAELDEPALCFDPSVERERFIRLLKECGNNRAEAARRLGISKSTFHAQLLRVGLPKKFAR